MRFSLRPPTLVWTIVLIGTVGFLLWLNAARSDRVSYVTALGGGAAATVDRSSPTGYSGGVRLLIAPERNAESYQWIAQTQQMFARGEWRVRHVDYDNAPAGRDVRTPSLYRWWLGFVGWFDYSLSIRPLGLSVERAALLADPALHLLLLMGATVFIAWQFGAWPALFLALAIALLHPFAGGFLPGQPGDQGWIQTAALWSVLLLLAGLRKDLHELSEERVRIRRQQWFFAGGVVGALGLWLSVPAQLPLLIGIAAGGTVASLLTRREAAAANNEMPWRPWALGGALTTLVAYFAEYFPAHMASLSVDTIHPLHGIAWLGAGELLGRADGGIRCGRPVWTRRSIAVVGLSVCAVAALPVVMALSDGRGVFAAAPLAARLSNLPNAPIAGHLFAWISQPGTSATFWATVLPLGVAAFAGWLLVRRQTGAADRQALALALGPVVVALGFAVAQLRWWTFLDSVLIALLVATVAAATRSGLAPVIRRAAAAAAAVALLPGALLLLPPKKSAEGYAVTPAEVEALIERDLAHWLAKRAGPGAVVLAPPQLTTSLFFHGGLRGLGTPYVENQDGFAAAVRIAGTTATDETLALVERRGLTHIVLPSWDRFLDEYARLGAGQLETTFIDSLHQWMPPRWLRPVAYQMPAIEGFESQSVAVFEVVELQENAVALSRLAEYFLEMGRLELAVSASYTLSQHFATDLGATVARAQVEAALPNGGEFSSALASLDAQLSAGADSHLSWDRRVALALVLARGKRFEQARTQLERCLAEMDEPRLRSLTTAPLYRLQVLMKAFGLEIPDPRLRALARELLPAELREIR